MWVVGEKRRDGRRKVSPGSCESFCAEERKGRRRGREDKVGFYVSTVIFSTSNMYRRFRKNRSQIQKHQIPALHETAFWRIFVVGPTR